MFGMALKGPLCAGAEMVPKPLTTPSAASLRRSPPSLYSARGREIGPPARKVDGDLLARHRAIQDPRACPRGCCLLLLRSRGEDQRLHGRVSGAESRPCL